MEKYLPYLTTIITVLATVGGGVFSFVKWIAMKNTEEKRLRYENLNKILENLSGKILDNGQIVANPGFVIGNIYKLIEFKEYSHIILPVLNYNKECPINAMSQKQLLLFNEAILHVEEQLLNQNKKVGQILRFAQNDSEAVIT